MSQPIRILFQVDSLGIGGIEKKVTQLVLRLDRRRFDPVVAYGQDWGPRGDELRRADIPVVRIVPVGARRRGVVKATEQIREIGPQIFHTFSSRQNASDVVVAKRAEVPVVISARDNVRQWAPYGTARDWEFERNRLTHFVTPCCDAAAQLCREIEGVRAENIVTIYNGVDLPVLCAGTSIRDELALPTGAFLIGYAAPYRSLKAHENLIRSMRKMVDRRRKIHLVCCGEDEDNRKEQLQTLVSCVSLDGNVTLLGPRANMDSFYRGIDLYVHPARSEAFSMSILEAMSYALPVVATSVGGTPEAVLHQVTGLLVPRSSPSELAKAVVTLVDQPEERLRMGIAGRERVREHFSVAQMAAAYETLYLRAVNPPIPQNVAPPAPEFSGGETCPALADTTIFVTTIGDKANFPDCMDHLCAQSVRCRIEIVNRVAPMSAAFAAMHERCATPYYVQVDEDMILRPRAIEMLHEMIAASPPDVALVCAPLWDCDVERPILGVKIYRHAIVKQFPYEDTISCEVRQLDRIRAAGYKAELITTETENDSLCLGEHGKHYTPETIFRRWQRHFHKHNRLGHLAWLEPWPMRLLERYTVTRDLVHLYALLGAVSGIAGRADPDKELDWRDIDPALQRMRYYFPTQSEPGS